MKILLIDTNPAIAAEWQKIGSDCPNVEAHVGNILDFKADAIVAAGNSFGFMDGGLDLLYRDRFGMEIEKSVQEAIAIRHQGELLVGMADAFLTNDESFPIMIYAPTMRVPLNIRQSVNAYLAAKAVFRLVLGDGLLSSLTSIAFPGLGTGCGMMAPSDFVRQFKAAIKDNDKPFPSTLRQAQVEHHCILAGVDYK